METKLKRIEKLAEDNPDMKFTSLVHLLNEENLKSCHHELPAGKATGVQKITKEEYGENLDENIASLVNQMKRKSYKPVPVEEFISQK